MRWMGCRSCAYQPVHKAEVRLVDFCLYTLPTVTSDRGRSFTLMQMSNSRHIVSRAAASTRQPNSCSATVEAAALRRVFAYQVALATAVVKVAAGNVHCFKIADGSCSGSYEGARCFRDVGVTCEGVVCGVAALRARDRNTFVWGS